MRWMIGLMALVGCATLQPTPVPQAARLSTEVLTLTLSDGTVCRASWKAAGGAGRFEDCAPGFGYAVNVVENPNLLRQLFTGLTDALGAEGVVPPMAEVVVTDATGRDHVFVSPPPGKRLRNMMRRSTRLFLAGAIPLAVGAGLFWWGASTELTPAEGLTRADVMQTIGQVAGAVGGIGVAIWAIALVMRARGR